ncbi:conserved hypothetical protein [Vibrio nigripulchritudo SOn1]|uniref:DUF559 domain-containing protein n=1 Tax=Vibrio nigripulchritudo SOn1 TaxID=1238450 RepID=A0AAV2VPT9_9VIBR|nr:hypothetical protein [Vibrio nigripulchritudo]CCO46682.1 conserved hypothetical protein [Vibrio nigripulchritudo SOn1]
MTEAQLEKLAKAGNVLAGQALRDYKQAKAPKRTNGKPLKTVPAKRKGNKGPSGLESSFAMQVKAAGLPMPQWGKDELMFHPKRRWRFDFAWEEHKVAVEIEGGTYSHGKKRIDSGTGEAVTQKSRHLTPTGFYEDCVKYGEAAILGWCVLRVDAKMVKDGSALEMLERAIKERVSG